MDGDSFGQSVSVSDDRVIVGAPAQNQPGLQGAGAAYVFARTPGGWIEEEKLSPSSVFAFGGFGVGVAVQDGIAVVGARANGGPETTFAGEVFVFGFQEGAGWVEKQKLVPIDYGEKQQFGDSVALDGSFLVVGAPSTGGELPIIGGAGSRVSICR